MLVFPNCKINLGLNIIRKRNDGYHDIETVFHPVDLKDALEIISNPDHNQFTVSGIPVENNDNNLCLKAYNLLKKDHPKLPFIKMHLHKAIPPGGGLGGGSADGTFTLQLLKEKFLPALSKGQLHDYAAQLGSDCPFFLLNEPCFASGRGETLLPINLDLSRYKIMIVNPGIEINTAWAFTKIEPAEPIKSPREIIAQPPGTWKHELTNDFETPVFEKFPAIKNIKTALYESGATYASLSGTGATVYGIFEKDVTINSQISGAYSSCIINLK